MFYFICSTQNMCIPNNNCTVYTKCHLYVCTKCYFMFSILPLPGSVR